MSKCYHATYFSLGSLAMIVLISVVVLVLFEWIKIEARYWFAGSKRGRN